MMRKTNNDELVKALNNIDNQNIIKYVTGKFVHCLDKEEREQCGRIGMVHALESHDYNEKTKFTSSLYKFVYWECLKERKIKIKQRYGLLYTEPEHLDSIKESRSNNLRIIQSEINECLTKISAKHQQVLRMYYYDNMTYEAIGKHFGFTKEWARQLILKGVDELRKVYNA